MIPAAAPLAVVMHQTAAAGGTTAAGVPAAGPGPNEDGWLWVVAAPRQLLRWKVLQAVVAVQHVHNAPDGPVDVPPAHTLLRAQHGQVVLESPGWVWLVGVGQAARAAVGKSKSKWVGSVGACCGGLFVLSCILVVCMPG